MCVCVWFCCRQRCGEDEGPHFAQRSGGSGDPEEERVGGCGWDRGPHGAGGPGRVWTGQRATPPVRPVLYYSAASRSQIHSFTADPRFTGLVAETCLNDY